MEIELISENPLIYDVNGARQVAQKTTCPTHGVEVFFVTSNSTKILVQSTSEAEIVCEAWK